MLCRYCNEEISPLSKECPHCATPVQEVQVMSPNERDNFRGITIVQDSSGTTFADDLEDLEQPYTNQQEQYEAPKAKRKFYYYSTANSSSGKMSVVSKIMLILILLGVVFFVIPAILTMVMIAAVLWFIWSIFS